MKYNVTDIDFDTDGEEVDLPNELVIDVPNEITDADEIHEYIEDEISKITGYCHNGFVFEKQEPKFVFDEVNCRVVTADDEHNMFYTEELTCSNDVVNEVVRIMNTTEQEFPLGSEGEIDIYLLDAPCTQEDRELIVESLFLYYNKEN
jgi:hypothetical protein